jgi:oligo-1,6-glucosidase/alpha-glucosidase
MLKNLPWWQTTTIYQIYPRSYLDLNGDGIGDIQGIISKLDYIQELGFETIWFSPFFKSPQGDFGYDISDYYSIAPVYGDLEIVQKLIDEIHIRKMRVIFDLVMNHTSIEHPWFQESRSSRDNPKSDWYIWRDGRGKNPPNNWHAIPGGSGWHYEKNRDQWYYGSFLPFMADLNYRNPQVKLEMLNVARYWLNKGVDGFRLDIFHAIYKDEQFRDNPFSVHYIPTQDLSAGWFQKWVYNLNLPETYEFAKELRSFVEKITPDALLLGEVDGSDEAVRAYLGEQGDGLHLVFLWKLLYLKPTAAYFRGVVREYEREYANPLMPVYVFGNHDVKRLLSKIKGDLRIAKLLAVFQFTVRGVPVTYYGEEIGMRDGKFPLKKAFDPMGRKYSWIPDKIVALANIYVNRDGCRTPMQWDASPHAGFTGPKAVPWLPLNPDYFQVNVENQISDPDSLWNIYKGLLRLRKKHYALQAGSLRLLDIEEANPKLLVFTRELDEEKFLVIINFAKTKQTYANNTDCKQLVYQIGEISSNKDDMIEVGPFSAIIFSR